MLAVAALRPDDAAALQCAIVTTIFPSLARHKIVASFQYIRLAIHDSFVAYQSHPPTNESACLVVAIHLAIDICCPVVRCAMHCVLIDAFVIDFVLFCVRASSMSNDDNLYCVFVLIDDSIVDRRQVSIEVRRTVHSNLGVSRE